MSRMKTDKKSLQRSPFKRVVEVQAPDDHTVIIVTKKPEATFITQGADPFGSWLLISIPWEAYHQGIPI
ncbi:MAG: hypothetical protein ACE5JU_03310 [Candidatus Binatia bacterium]